MGEKTAVVRCTSTDAFTCRRDGRLCCVACLQWGQCTVKCTCGVVSAARWWSQLFDTNGKYGTVFTTAAATTTTTTTNNRIQRRYSRFFTISSQRRELSPTRTLKWPVRNRAQITCNTSSAYHVQVSCHVPLGTKGQLSY